MQGGDSKLSYMFSKSTSEYAGITWHSKKSWCKIFNFEGSVQKYLTKPATLLNHTFPIQELLQWPIQLPNSIDDTNTRLLLNHVQHDPQEASRVCLCI
jgi:hypothetical protein